MSALPSDAAPLRTLPWSERAYQATLTTALFMLGFFVLFSTAGTSLALGVLGVLCLLSPQRLWATRPWREPVLALGVALLAYIAARTLLQAGMTRESLGTLNRYHELLMLPVLWALMRVARRPQAFANGLILGSLAYAIIHWLAPWEPQLVLFLQSRRISAGFGLAICAYLLFEHARLGRLPAAPAYGASAFLAATVIFASAGRTGHVVLLALLLCAAFRAAPPRVRLSVVLAMFVASLLIAGASNPIRQRLAETLRDAQSTSAGTAQAGSSTALRIELLRRGAEVARTHWLLGTGWGAYAQAFQGVAPLPAGNGEAPAAAPPGDNPHNEYLLQLGAGGLPALLLYLAWLATPMWHALRERRESRPWSGAVGCVALAFALSSLFNSVLRDFVEGHFYGALLAWLLVRRVED